MILCKNCNNFYGSELSENLCTKCYLEIIGDNIKCIKCKKYFKYKNDFCSQCFIENQYKNINLTLEEIFALPDSYFKSKLIDHNIASIFKLFKKENKIKFKLIKSETEFKIILNLCKNKNSNEIFLLLNGLTDILRPSVLYAKHADILLTQCFESKKDEQFKYIHSICPYIIDIWNIKNNNQVLLCYYKDFGELVRCPTNIDRLIMLWSRMIKPQFIPNFSNNIINICSICLENVKIYDRSIKCLHCNKFLHYNCFIKFLETTTTLDFKCPSCKTNWRNKTFNDNEDYIFFHYYTFKYCYQKNIKYHLTFNTPK